MSLSRKAVCRLTTLIKFMEALPRSAAKHFNMTTWIAHAGPHSHDFDRYIRPGDLETCGTTACAFGWAATIPTFRRAGLKVVNSIEESGRHDNYTVAKEFFDLNDWQTGLIFGSSSVSDPNPFRLAKSPKQWARLARRFLREHEAV